MFAKITGNNNDLANEIYQEKLI
ncbi:hypothetical protein AGR1C_Lc20089 [Agrobacterium fabacearum TT111]|nr:hypothetical protein AGR1C_Lc20089 [Agrobacterium fabacearum TT111]